MRADKQGSPATIAEGQSYSKMYNELFRYHSRHADFARYGDEGNPSGLRAQFGATAQSIFTNVTYNQRELRALYLKTDLLAAGELLASDDPDGPGAGPRDTELRKKHARAAGIDIPELSADQRSGIITAPWTGFSSSEDVPRQTGSPRKVIARSAMTHRPSWRAKRSR
jgi:hypothetical protein